MDAGLATAAAVLARVLGVVTGGAAVLPETSARIRLAFAVALAVVALPLAVETQRTDAAPAVGRPADVVALVAGEAVLGLACGAALAAAASAGAWAGGILGSVAGLSWSDDFAPEGDAQAAGMARLAWWISCGVFLAAGGLQTIVVALLDSVRLVPVGSLFALGAAPGPALGRLAAEIPGVAFSLALALSVPALLAVIGFHLVMAVALRTVPLVPGIGLLQALAALVLLGAVCLGADAWVHGFPDLVQGPVERIFGPR